MINTCSNIVPEYKDVACCNDHVNKSMIIWAKKGMAAKAMVKNIITGNNKNLNKQIKKGTVIIKSK